MDIASLALGALATLAGQQPADDRPGAPSRFIACPGHPRCPTRPHVGVSGGGGHEPPSPFIRPDVSYYTQPFAGGGGGDGSLTISFAPGAFGLEESTRRELDEWVAPLASSTSVIVIEGHADENSTIGDDARLAAHRAEAIAGHLAGRGIPPERLRVIAWGSSERGTISADEAHLRGLRAVVITTGN